MIKHCVWVMVAVAGCYSPTIADKDFYCGDQGQCPMGFRCVDLVCLKNSTATPTPYGAGNLPALDLTGMSGRIELDTTTGAIRFATPTGGSELVPAGGGQSAPQPSAPGGPEVMIWSFAKLTVPPMVIVTVSPASQRVPVLSSPDEVIVAGDVLLHEYGFIGGAPGSDGEGYGAGAHALEAGGGGGGGGHGTAGTAGAGGGGAGGAPYGEGLVLFGSGGAGGSATSPARGGDGGTGGGAIALIAKKLTVGGTIDVTGGQGGRGVSTSGPAGGGGGGAGGSIYLAGETVILTGAKLDASGGDGGAGAAGGMTGGKGGVGRIHVAGTVQGDPTMPPMPMLTKSPAIARFPR